MRAGTKPTPTNNHHRPEQKGSQVASDAARGISKALIWLMTLPARLIAFLTTPPGSAIPVGFAVLYFSLLSAEGYWQSMTWWQVGAAPSFVPKPFINDGADPANIFVALGSASFYVAFVVSLVIQAVQAKMLRDVEIAKAQAEYEAIKDYRVPEVQKDQIDLAEHRRQRLKTAGMRRVRVVGFVVFMTYAVDIAIAFWNYPLWGNGVGQLVVNLVWLVLSIIGTEAAIAMLLDIISPIKPEVEVLPNER